MKRKLTVAWLLLTALAWGQGGLPERTLTVDGRERTYLVAEPDRLDRPMALVLVFHGGGGNARQIARHTGFAELARREGFLAVFPQGYKGNWNDGRADVKSPAFQDQVDDLAFVNALLDELAARYQVDKVYVTGVSNGGMFSQFLAARMADRIQAAAPVVGGIPEPIAASFAPARPVSMLIIQGTDDPLVPYNGGGIGVLGGRGRIVSTERALSLWREVNGCSGKGEVTELPDRDPEDRCRVTRTVWHGNADVELYRIQNGGHGWPGGSQYLPRAAIGKVCQDFNATETIWEFFRNH